MLRTLMAAGLAFAFAGAGTAHAEDPFAKALFLTKSGTFQHYPITNRNDEPSVSETVLREVLAKQNIQLDATKDASRINADTLADYDLVIFYTQGDLTKEGLDGYPPMEPGGLQALFDWIKQGGGFIGFHSATDTLRPNTPDDPITPFTAMIGGAFLSHGQQFEGTLRLVDASHPTLAGVPDGFSIKDEWYTFQHVDRDGMHVLALLDPGEERDKQDLYNRAPYPVIWCKASGKGRIYYNAMGHRPDVWANATFHRMIANAARWALGQTDLHADPNYAQTVKASTD